MDRPIANQQDGVRLGIGRCFTDGKRLERWLDAEPLTEQDANQSHACPRALIQCQRGNLFQRHTAEQLHTPNRSAAGNASVRNDGVLGVLERFDGGDQRDIQIA